MPTQDHFKRVVLRFIGRTEPKYRPYFSKFLEERFDGLWLEYQKDHEIGLYDPRRQFSEG